MFSGLANFNQLFNSFLNDLEYTYYFCDCNNTITLVMLYVFVHTNNVLKPYHYNEGVYDTLMCRSVYNHTMM